MSTPPTFESRKIHGIYDLSMPDFLAAWDVWEYWEKPRLDSMKQHLGSGDILFEVGAEAGWMAALYGKYFVGGENLVLFEPTPEYWPNIKATWDANDLKKPLRTCCALVSHENCNAPLVTDDWPDEALTGVLTPARAYKYIHEHGATTPQISLDAFEQLTGVIPKGISIDVEGAEFNVLCGAKRMLMKHKPLVWLSIHSDLLLRDYKRSVQEIHELMDNLGFEGEYLGTDHEAHWLWRAQ
jgi:FkbM family methyltransferase